MKMLYKWTISYESFIQFFFNIFAKLAIETMKRIKKHI